MVIVTKTLVVCVSDGSFNGHDHGYQSPVADSVSLFLSLGVWLVCLGNWKLWREFWLVANESIYRIGHSSGG